MSPTTIDEINRTEIEGGEHVELVIDRHQFYVSATHDTTVVEVIDDAGDEARVAVKEGTRRLMRPKKHIQLRAHRSAARLLARSSAESGGRLSSRATRPP
jgi:hypothetical protein